MIILYLLQIFFIYVPLLQVRIPTPRYLATIETENALRRSRIEAELAASRAATEAALASRIEAETRADRAYKDEVLRRSRLQAESAAQTAALRRSRFED